MTTCVKAIAEKSPNEKASRCCHREARSAPCGALRLSKDYFFLRLAFFLRPFFLPAFFAVPFDAFFFLRVAIVTPPSAFRPSAFTTRAGLNMKRYKMFNS